MKPADLRRQLNRARGRLDEVPARFRGLDWRLASGFIQQADEALAEGQFYVAAGLYQQALEPLAEATV